MADPPFVASVLGPVFACPTMKLSVEPATSVGAGESVMA
jgi:hypothetical protein